MVATVTVTSALLFALGIVLFEIAAWALVQAVWGVNVWWNGQIMKVRKMKETLDEIEEETENGC